MCENKDIIIIIINECQCVIPTNIIYCENNLTITLIIKQIKLQLHIMYP